MAFSSNPKIPTDGLVLALDPADTNSYRLISSVEVMVVGGGGGGGMDMGGGGGGGGVLYDPNHKVTPGVGITVTVGAGGFGAPTGGGYRTDGAGPQPNSHQFTISATNGSDSVFGNLIAKGGGFGASSYYGYAPNSGTGGTGASGGGCSAYTHGGERYVDNNNIVGQGFPGGNSGNPTTGADDHWSGGGGGAGGRGTSGPGHVAPSGNAGHGGPGILISRMSSFYHSGGGGGSAYSGTKGGDGGLGGGGGAAAGGNGNTVGFGDTNGRNPGVNGGLGNNQPGGNGGANTGGGGGGGSHYNANNKGGEGGSGVVIVRYNGPQAASGGTYTSVNGVSFHTFTSSGTFTPNTSHTVWHDVTNRGHNFTLENGPTFNSGNSGHLAFDGTNDIATILTTPSTLQGDPSLTICGFFRRTGNITGRGIFGIGGEGTNGGINSWNYDNTNQITIDTWSQSTFTTGATYPLNEWVFVAWQKIAGNMTRANCIIWRNLVSYTDSQLSILRSETGIPNINAYGVTVGSISRTTAYCAAMDVGTFFIYNKVLTPAEIAQNFNATRSRFGV